MAEGFDNLFMAGLYRRLLCPASYRVMEISHDGRGSGGIARAFGTKGDKVETFDFREDRV